MAKLETGGQDTNALHELGYKIFLDRYAQKDMTRATLTVGDIVIVVVDSKTGQREIGKITAIALPQITVELLDGTVVTRDLEHVDKPLETDPGQMMDRVAAGIASIETNPEKQKEWTKKFRWLLDGWKFVPGGRILTGAGTDQQLTYYNCYVIPMAGDSREGIMKTLTQMTEIMSRGGGVGINLSTLRPRHAYVKGVNGRSSGAVSWGALYSFVTGLIEQGGCFGPNERILTDQGLIPAEELADRIESGESILAQTHKGLRPITYAFRNGVKPLYEMTTERGYRVRITADHKVAVIMDGTITTMPLKYLQPGDEILLLLGEGVNSNVPAVIDEAQAYLAGSSANDSVPEAIFRSPSSVQMAFVAGYMDADNRSLASEIQQLLAINGVLSVRQSDNTLLIPARIAAVTQVYAGVTQPFAAERRPSQVVSDHIASILSLGDSQVYDFEVAEVHLLSGAGIYTSNSRRGALMLILNDWHPDVFDFISSKRKAGNITNANISVGISDKFMDAVKNDEDWALMFPDTSDPDYDQLWDGDLDTWIAMGRKTHTYKTVKAREVWNTIIESAWASAEPGLWFRERSNKMANSWYFNPLISTNPCVTGDTRIHTNRGLIKAVDLFNDETEIEVAIDGRFGLDQATTPATRVFMTGHKPVYRLQTREGYSIRATADHRFMTPRGWVELRDLNPGDKVHIMNRKGGFGQEGSLELGRVLGWLVGDGTIKADRAVLSFFGDEKRELAPVFAEYVEAIAAPLTVAPRSYNVGVIEVGGRDEARVQSERLRRIVAGYGLVENKHQVPEVVFRGTEDMQRGFLQALFTADGSVQYASGTLNVRLASSNLPLLEQVQVALSNFGIASRIYRNRRQAAYRNLPDGKGGLKPYLTQAQHELNISKTNALVFAKEIGFILERKQTTLQAHLDRYVTTPRSESFVARIDSITAEGIEAVYDLTEPLTSSFIANSLVIHNCGEQPLGAFSVCNLGAINLSRFYDAKNHDVAWDDLQDAVHYSVRFLDNVIDSTPYFFEENARIQGAERRVGLGTMGVAELMIKLGVRYGSEESVEFINKLYKFIAVQAYATSSEIAKEKGAFPAFEAEKFLESGFMQQMPEDIREKIREDGIRNVTLLTQAPTGTTGTLVNTSTGIEPFFSWVYYRKSRLGLHEEQVPLVKDWYEQHLGETELPEYFVTAMGLSPKEHVKVQAAFQRWIDSAISKTVNCPNEWTVEEVSELYMYMYDQGCKGGTIYRDGSRDEQVLMLKGDERAEEEMKQVKKEPEKPAQQVATPHRVYPRPKKLQGVTSNIQTPFGTAYVTMNSDEHGYPFEVFITAPGKAGSDLQADAEGLGRMISLSLRTTDPHNRNTMLRLIIDQLRDIGGARSVGFGEARVMSLPDAVARALEETYFPKDQPQQMGLPILADEIKVTTPKKVETTASNGHKGELNGADVCPSCANITLIRAEGCRKCLSCGYSEC